MALQIRQDDDNLYKFFLQHPEGVTMSDLQANNWVDRNQILKVANLLLQDNMMQIVDSGAGNLMFKMVDPGRGQKYQGLDPQHMLVCQLIEKAADKGIWSKKLKDQSNLAQHAIGRITKELVKRHLIKEVISVEHRGRNVFMLWELEPAREVSGGNWYFSGEFAADWVEELRARCRMFLEQTFGQPSSLQEIHGFALEQPGPSVPSEGDIEAIMRTLELDEEVWRVRDQNGQSMYALRNRPGSSPFNVFAARLPSFVTQIPIQKMPFCMGLVSMGRTWTSSRSTHTDDAPDRFSAFSHS